METSIKTTSSKKQKGDEVNNDLGRETHSPEPKSSNNDERKIKKKSAPAQ